MRSKRKKDKKQIKFIFLDTNVLYHCRFFTKIDWNSLFQEKPDQIQITIPNQVIEELDEGKYHSDNKLSKRARKIISKIRQLEGELSFEANIIINLSLDPPPWNKLKRNWKKVLYLGSPDSEMIAEILIFSKTYSKDDIYFISGDFLPLERLKRFGFNVIDWRDKKFGDVFVKVKEKEEKFHPLQICFNPATKDNKITVNAIFDDPDLMEFIPKKEILQLIPEEIKRMPIVEIQNLENSEQYLEVLSPKVKTDMDFKEEIERYNKKMSKFYRFKEFELFLMNNGNIPYNDIDIRINTIVEKDLEIEYYSNLEEPRKPKRHEKVVVIKSYVSYDYDDDLGIMDYICHSIRKEKNERNNTWYFGYNVRKLKHNEYIKLASIAIRIPENFSSNEIHFNCTFTQEEKGKIKPQLLRIILG